MAEQLLTLPEVAEQLRVSVRTIQRLMSSGQLRPTRIGRRTLIAQREIDAFRSAAYRRTA